MSDVERDFWGDPRVEEGWLGGEYVTVDGKRYEIVSRSGDKIIAKEADAIFGGDEKVLERGLLGGWTVRDRGIFD